MSHLLIKTKPFGTFRMNVLQFTSPIFGTLSAVQTRTMLQHFPIKANQPNIEFVVVFPSEYEYERFQKFVKATQNYALTIGQESITLSWPERGINNWTGVIKEFRAGGARRNYTPRARFTVDLVTSMVSEKAFYGSTGTPFSQVLGPFILDADTILKLPEQYGGVSLNSGVLGGLAGILNNGLGL